jgi:hypothetical protein
MLWHVVDGGVSLCVSLRVCSVMDKSKGDVECVSQFYFQGGAQLLLQCLSVPMVAGQSPMRGARCCLCHLMQRNFMPYKSMLALV